MHSNQYPLSPSTSQLKNTNPLFSKHHSPHSLSTNQFLVTPQNNKYLVQRQKCPKQQRQLIEPVLATIYINMGQDRDRPVLTVKRSTNVILLINNFINQYQLPYQAYNIIYDRVKQQLGKQNIDVNKLGNSQQQKSYEISNKRVINETDNQITNRIKHSNQQNIRNQNNKEQPNNILNQKKYKGIALRSKNNQKNTMKAKIKQDECLNINNKRKKSISPIRLPAEQTIVSRPRSPHQTKIMFPKCKTPLSRKSDISPNNSSHSNIKNNKIQRIANKQVKQITKQMIKKLENLFDILTKYQPKNIQTISSEYINFDGIGPQTLSVLQDFFKSIKQCQFSYMTKNYFVNKMIERGICSKISKMTPQEFQLK